MRRILLATVFAAATTLAQAAQTPKEQLATPPANARHYTITSTAGKHGDIWSWTTPDGRVAYRMSMSLRGWVTEDEEMVTLGADHRPTAIAIRGYTDQGDATEDFSVDLVLPKEVQLQPQLVGVLNSTCIVWFGGTSWDRFR